MKPRVCFLYAPPLYHSGQAFASRILIEGFRSRGMLAKVIELPAFCSNKKGFIYSFSYIYNFILSFFQMMFLEFNKNCVLHVNLGQTIFSFIREGIVLVFFSILRGSNCIVIGLHGSNFMQWNKNSLNAMIFKYLVSCSSKVCVLGLSQKLKLSELGIHPSNIEILPNTCSLEPKDLKDKINSQINIHRDQPFKVLYLSNLIPSKGFPEFLETLQILTHKNKLKIQAVLCGKIVPEKLEGQFSSEEELERWINNRIEKINLSSNITVSWQAGAEGKIKENLFYESDLFVLPTTNDAQPIVLIEALASGCAIITTDVGEITSTVSKNEATILEEPNPRYLAESIEEILSNTKKRINQIEAGHTLFNRQFAMAKHLDNWHSLFEEIIWLRKVAE